MKSGIIETVSKAPDASKPILAICGAGNAGHALAVVTSQRFDGDVYWLTGSEEKADALSSSVFSGEGLQSAGVISGRADRIALISADPEKIIPKADIVLIAVPAFAHAIVLEQIAPHLSPHAILGVLPSRSGFEFEVTAILGDKAKGRGTIFGLQTLPWSTRVQEVGKRVHFGALKAKVLLATMPSSHAPRIARLLTRLLGTEFVATPNFLNMTLGNPGQIIHPGLMYGFFGAWSGETYGDAQIPHFYADATDRIGEFVEELSNDILRVARRIEVLSRDTLDLSGVLSVHDWLRISYPTQTQDVQSVATCFRTGPLQHRKAPMLEREPGEFVPDFRYRYLGEDVPYGLAVTRAFAEIAGVQTPAVDAVLNWAQAKLGTRYLIDGEMRGEGTQSLPLPQNHGVDSIDAVVDWYASRRGDRRLQPASVR
ncbi:MAG TPA: NAD/NADP octopine/nopaline dehydrogenase family protein [Candidatus Baltobacteraceae bacterium]|nr:NAD/NADP octopine/nopaline dehydrogenase family protein [Candidatus Baltobacteraceae bacterium]